MVVVNKWNRQHIFTTNPTNLPHRVRQAFPPKKWQHQIPRSATLATQREKSSSSPTLNHPAMQQQSLRQDSFSHRRSVRLFSFFPGPTDAPKPVLTVTTTATSLHWLELQIGSLVRLVGLTDEQWFSAAAAAGKTLEKYFFCSLRASSFLLWPLCSGLSSTFSTSPRAPGGRQNQSRRRTVLNTLSSSGSVHLFSGGFTLL